MESINKLKNDHTIFIIPDDEIIKKELTNYNIVSPNKEYNINGLVFRTVPSYNINKKFHPKDNNWLGYIVTIDNETYYIMGDTDVTDESKLVKCDYLFIPIGGYYTMDYKEASILTNIIKPRVVYPIHFGSIIGDKDYYDKFKVLINKETEVINKLY